MLRNLYSLVLSKMNSTVQVYTPSLISSSMMVITIIMASKSAKAVERGLLEPDAEMNARTTFKLVRDMPYMRASDRQPETLIREWRGTCSGKHYLLKDLYAEMGIPSRVMACTHVAHFDPKEAAPELRRLLEQTGGRFVDVHNYLVLELTEGEMIVDATWP
jgi:hypothetical protein